MFNLNSKFFDFMYMVSDIIILNLIFLIMCLPIITIGASITAMYYVTLKLVRDKEPYIIRSFFKAFKDNFKQASFIWLLFLAFIIIMLVDYRFLVTQIGWIKNVFIVLFAIMGVCLWSIKLYVFPLLAQFDNTIKNMLKNGLLFSIKNMPKTIILMLIDSAPIIFYLSISYSIRVTIPYYLFIGFSVSALISSYILNKIFRVYIDVD